MQLIFLVESDKKSQSDYNYISATINYYYKTAGIKLTPIFLASKGNYNKKDVEIKRNMDKYSGKTRVFICYDIDNQNSPTFNLNAHIESYAKANGYETIWFYEDIEQVYVKQIIPNNEKTKRAIRFTAHKEIEQVVEQDLVKQIITKKNTSNILYVLDKYLIRK